MRLPSAIKNALTALLGVIFIICAIVGTHFYFYPYGNSGSGLAGTAIDLHNYANDHKGWFPNKTGPPVECLSMLYPYAPSGDLAGISGNRTEARKRIDLGLDLDERISSIVYFPGLRDSDDAELMLFYERQEGVSTTGRRLNGHAVGFVGGFVQQIPRKDWERFLKQQQILRTAAMANRTVPTNTDELVAGEK